MLFPTSPDLCLYSVGVGSPYLRSSQHLDYGRIRVPHHTPTAWSGQSAPSTADLSVHVNRPLGDSNVRHLRGKGRLHAWRLLSVPSRSQAFRDGLRASYPYVSESPLPACTNRNGSHSINWCRGRSITPIDATIPVIVDFLIHLRQDKSFSLSALEGLSLYHKLGFQTQGLGLSKLEGTINALPQSCKNLFSPGPQSPSLGRGPGPTEFDQPTL